MIPGTVVAAYMPGIIPSLWFVLDQVLGTSVVYMFLIYTRYVQ